MAFAWSLDERRLIYRNGLAIRGVAAAAFLSLFLAVRLAGWGDRISALPWLEALLLALIAVNPLLWIIGKARNFDLADFNVHWALDLGAATAALYCFGTLDIPLSACVYMIMIVTSATFADRRTSLRLAVWSAISLVLLVAVEELGIVQHQHVAFGTHLTGEGKIVTLAMATTWFFVFGYIAGALAEQLRGKAVAVEEQRRSLEVAYGKEQASREGMELLSALVQHDVYSPLGVVSGACGEALRSCEEGDLATCGHFVRMIDDRLRSIESAVATLGLFEIGKRDIAAPAFSLRVLVEEIVEDLRAEWTERSVLVTLEGEWPLIGVKRQLVYHTVRNLISNSVKSVSDDGSGRVRIISRRSGTDEEEAMLSVVDNGPGVSEEVRARLFALPKDNEPRKSGSGLGAGLALSANVVRNWGGKLAYQPSVGRGSNFTMTFPRDVVRRWV
jgi:signal transduction histidine kinase